jgi:signal transduction histidine kinase
VGPGRLAGLPTKIAVGFVAAFLCLVATALVTLTFEAVRDRQARLMLQASATLVVVEELEVSIKVLASTTQAAVNGLETPERLAEATGRRHVVPALDSLERLSAEEPSLREQYLQVRPMIMEMLVAAERTAAALSEGRGEEARRLAAPVEVDAMNRAMALLEEMELEESGILLQREASWRRAAVTGLVVFAVATLALLALILAAARMVRTEIRERERLAAELEAQVGLQQQLMAIVGHDLRNPLTSMKTGAALLARSPELSDHLREDAGRILSNARRMERLIGDLLDYTRLHAGVDLPVAPVEVQLVDLTRRAVSDLGREAEERVTVEGRGDVGGVWDPDRLEQVVANLVTNALKYGPPQRPVRVVVDGGGDGVTLSVSDEGGGLSPLAQQGLFEPFRPARGGDGAGDGSIGLGLYVVRRIAEAHGGQVAVDSAAERGTTFTVCLPRGRAPRADPPAPGG